MEGLAMVLATPFIVYPIFAIFIFVWWNCCKWLFIWFVKIGETYFKKDSLPYKVYMTVFVGFGGLASIYLFIWIFLMLAKDLGF